LIAIFWQQTGSWRPALFVTLFYVHEPPSFNRQHGNFEKTFMHRPVTYLTEYAFTFTLASREFPVALQQPMALQREER